MPLIVSMQVTDPALGAQSPRRLEIDQRLSIGRGPENDLVLLDPARVLSKSHCVIEAAGAVYMVTDSSTNGVFLNNSPERLSRGVPTPIQPGDLLQIGGYVFEVTGLHERAAPADFAADFEPGPSAAPGAEPDPFDDLLAEFGSGPTANPARPTPGGAGDFTPFDPPPFEQRLTDHRNAEPLGRARADELLPPDVDDLFGDPPDREQWQGASQPDHAPATSSFFAPPKATNAQIPDDWDDLLDFSAPGSASPAPTPARPPMPERNAFEEPEDFLAPAPAPAPAPMPVAKAATPGAAARPAPVSTEADRGAVAALLAAAGLGGITLNDAESAALMARVGRMLSILVPGLIEILAARGSTKQEFHIERTMLGAQNNNPLKFPGSTDEAMRVMLLQHVPGFLPVDKAVEQALGDIKAHQLAVLAGMQTALKTVIGRFEPAQLEARLEHSSLLDGILPAARKARYWELFKALHGTIVHELQDDLQKLFGQDFADAYRAQIDRLQTDDRTAGRETS
jgi:type VI secretion system FHA domain protein